MIREKSRAIVLHTTDYSDSSLIVNVYTEEYGARSYITGGVRKFSKFDWGKSSKCKKPFGWLIFLTNENKNHFSHHGVSSVIVFLKTVVCDVPDFSGEISKVLRHIGFKPRKIDTFARSARWRSHF